MDFWNLIKYPFTHDIKVDERPGSLYFILKYLFVPAWVTALLVFGGAPSWVIAYIVPIIIGFAVIAALPYDIGRSEPDDIHRYPHTIYRVPWFVTGGILNAMFSSPVTRFYSRTGIFLVSTILPLSLFILIIIMIVEPIILLYI